MSAVDSGFLLGAMGTFEPFEGMSDPVPDRDGTFTIIVVDLAPLENAGTGKGVLSRLTLRAKASGLSPVAPGFHPPDVYPALVDLYNTTIEVRSIAGIVVAIGEDCPAGLTEIQPTPLPSLEELSGSPTRTPSPTPTPSPTATASPAVLPAAFPATGGTQSSSNIAWAMVSLAVLALGVGALCARRRHRSRR